MNINIVREACCSQDDQCGVLMIKLPLSVSTTIQELAQEIGEVGFLQFTSTHNVIFAYSGNKALFSIPAKSFTNPSVEYFVPKTGLVQEYVVGLTINFKW
ncbi:hypothetical protein [Vibrio aestuarianus]|uniref:hypothetical protein n=1 Tax=Vibrio aestuarianus TaxID=28171 RepID=UPI00237CA0C0|nr:hypothetical protein [Vibrio aestuarianus]MDE1233352.1 hypothetical protein [Vibrio aestuarianus]